MLEEKTKMNSEFVKLKDKQGKHKKCIINGERKGLYVRNDVNHKKEQYVRQSNKMIRVKDYKKQKKTKKIVGGDNTDYLLIYHNNNIKFYNITNEKLKATLLNPTRMYFGYQVKAKLSDDSKTNENIHFTSFTINNNNIGTIFLVINNNSVEKTIITIHDISIGNELIDDTVIKNIQKELLAKLKNSFNNIGKSINTLSTTLLGLTDANKPFDETKLTVDVPAAP